MAASARAREQQWALEMPGKRSVGRVESRAGPSTMRGRANGGGGSGGDDSGHGSERSLGKLVKELRQGSE